MPRPVHIAAIFLLLVFAGCSETKINSQTESKLIGEMLAGGNVNFFNIEECVKEIALNGMVEGPAVSIAGSPSEQYARSNYFPSELASVNW